MNLSIPELTSHILRVAYKNNIGVNYLQLNLILYFFTSRVKEDDITITYTENSYFFKSQYGINNKYVMNNYRYYCSGIILLEDSDIYLNSLQKYEEFLVSIIKLVQEDMFYLLDRVRENDINYTKRKLNEKIYI